MTRVGLVPIVRSLFRGAQMGLWERSQRLLAEAASRLGFSLAFASPPVAEIHEARAQAEAAARADLDMLLVQHVTFATGDLLAPFLELPLPLGLWALPEATASGPLPQNALCGLNMSMSLPVRRSVPVKWFYGDPADEAFQRALEATVRAVAGRRAVMRGRLLWIGGTAPGFYRLETKPDLPLQIDEAPLERFFEALDGVTPSEVDARLKDVDEVTTFPRSDLRASVRVELALERLSHGYDGIALRCWPELPERAGAMACAAFARLADRGLPLACEGDIGGLASMLAVAAVTRGPAVMLDLSHAREDALLFWHCGNAPRAWAAGETRLTPHFNRQIPAVRDMRLKPGPVSGLRLLEDRTAAVYSGHAMPLSGGYDGVSGWIGALRWARNPITPHGYVATVLNHRLPHHFIWGLGDEHSAMLECCDWLGYRVLPADPEPRVVAWPA